MTDAMKIIDDLLAADMHAVQRELRRLRDIRDWALRHAADFGPGDRVVIAEPPTTDNGWHAYRECLTIGATATVHALDLVASRGIWCASIMLDREWSVSSGPGPVMRFWHGRAADTPDGMEPPTRYDRENYPDGRRHTFMVNVARLRRADGPGEVDTCG